MKVLLLLFLFALDVFCESDIVAVSDVKGRLS